jgi:hypothetical protein
MIMSLTQGLVPFSLPSLVTVHGRSTRTGFLAFFHHPRASRFHTLVTFLSIFPLTVQNENFFYGVSPRVARLHKSDTFRTCSSTSSRFRFLSTSIGQVICEGGASACSAASSFTSAAHHFRCAFQISLCSCKTSYFLLSMKPRFTELSPKVG